MRVSFALLVIVLLSAIALHAQKQEPPAPAPAAPSTQSARLPVKRVVLYKNGVGYFEHSTRVRGSQDLSIDFTTSQLNDVLKSLTVVDLGDGRISSVRYNSIAPLDERLKSLRLPVGAQTTTADFVAALRGARVEVRSGAARAVGRLLTVESVQRPAGKDGGIYTVTQFSIVGDDGEVRTFELTPGTGVRVLEGELKEEMGKYLNLIGSGRDRDVRRMTISATGTGERPVFVSYISEVPIWKSTYRIVMPTEAGKKPLLQGWAIVDNTTGEDWKDVQMSLVAGAPQSFIQDISKPYFGHRPVVALPESVSAAPQQHQASLTDSFNTQVPASRNVTGLFYAAPGAISGGSGLENQYVADFAGGSRGALSGTVYDSTGAVVPGVRLTLRGPTGVQTQNANREGQFIFQRLTPGYFSVRADRPGFKSTEVRGVEIVANKLSAIRVNLEPGAVSEVVEVSASAATVDNLSFVQEAQIRSGSFEGPQPEVAGGQAGDLFEYNLKQHITIGKNQSALVPIIQTRVEAEKVTIWNAGDRPRRAVWLSNGSGLTLDGGTFNVQDGGTFAGEGLLQVIHPAEKRLLSYAVDEAVHVTSENLSRPQPVTRVVIAKGVMTMTREDRQKYKYTIRNADDSARTVVIEHPRKSGWKLMGDLKPAETSESYDRFRVEVAANTTSNLEFEESHPLEQQYLVTNLTPNQIAVFSNEQSLKPSTEAALRKVMDQKAVISGYDRQIGDRQREMETIYREQSRLRENMKALKGSSEERTLLQRYTRELDGQEDRIAALKKEIAGLELQRNAASAALDTMISEIALDDAF